MSGPRFVVIGNPEDRRVTLFQEALRTQGLPSAEVVSWLEVLRHFERLEALSSGPALVRIDSAGESFDGDRELLKLGYEDAARAGVSSIVPEAVEALTHDRGLIL